ncbi:hypothetical protein ACJ41O_010496 [Fusarium nematophilum]
MTPNNTAGRGPIKIGSISGYSGDRLDALAHILSGPIEVDAIVSDYLAEMNLSWRQAEMNLDESRGYDPTFIETLRMAKAQLRRRVDDGTFPKIVVNAGALNPYQLAVAVHELLTSEFGDRGAALKIAYVTGDDILGIVTEPTTKRAVKNLNTEETLDSWPHDPVIANAYIGQSALVAALQGGADIVLAGRTTDASSTQALASWWFGWRQDDYDNHALGLVTGHLIECGAYVTGGNFCGFKNIGSWLNLAYPIAEIYDDGHGIVTKQPGQNGLVDTNTVRSQLLYEIQGRYYLNPDVIADLSSLKVSQEGPDRVHISAVKGLPPPPTLKVAIQAVVGYQAEMLVYAIGLDIEEKAESFEAQLRKDLEPQQGREPLRKLEVQLFGTAKQDPTSTNAATAVIRVFAQAAEAEPLTTLNFQQRIMQNLGQAFPGFTPNLEYHRTTVPRPYFTYFPGLISRSEVTTKVHWLGSETIQSISWDNEKISNPDDVRQENYETTNPVDLSMFGPTIPVPLGHKVFARSGDKGSNANVGFFPQDASQEAWDWHRSFLTTKRLLELLGGSDGIGSKVTEQLLRTGAQLVVADLNDAKGLGLVDALKKAKGNQQQQQNIVYKHVDVSDYDSILALFKYTVDLYGKVDMAIHCAGITEIPGWFDPAITLDTISKPPSSKVLDVNLYGTFYFTQIALAAMAHGRQSGEAVTDKSITLISSIAGFKESPGLFAYSASKHGVMGLMRSLRGYLPSAFSVRLNVVCPWATDTQMFANMRDMWVRESLPLNTPDEVARIVVQCTADERIHGRAVYVAGGRGFDIEEGIDRLELGWMGETQARDLARGQSILGTVSIPAVM